MEPFQRSQSPGWERFAVLLQIDVDRTCDRPRHGRLAGDEESTRPASDCGDFAAVVAIADCRVLDQPAGCAARGAAVRGADAFPEIAVTQDVAVLRNLCRSRR